MPKILPKSIIYQNTAGKKYNQCRWDNMRFLKFLRFLISTRYSRHRYKKYEKYLDDLRED